MNESLSEFVTVINKNWENLKTQLPSLAETAEAVHQAFYCFLEELRNIDQSDPAAVVCFTMAFGAHSSWIRSVISSAAAQLEDGFSGLRRAIEFACYAAKVSGSPVRAKLWIDQGSDPQALKTWKGQTAIPTSYMAPKYATLHSLLVNWDTASSYGVHANLQSMARNMQKGPGFGFNYHGKAESVPGQTAHAVLTGRNILKAFRHHLAQYLTNSKDCENLLQNAENRVQNMRSEIARASGAWSKEARKAIFGDDNPAMEKKFQELLDRYSSGKKSQK